MRCFPTLAEVWLVCYPSFSFSESYRHVPASSNIPFDSSCPQGSNEALPDPGGDLAGVLSFFFID